MKRLTFLSLAGLTAFDLHAALIQSWSFRDVNANGTAASSAAVAANLVSKFKGATS